MAVVVLATWLLLLLPRRSPVVVRRFVVAVVAPTAVWQQYDILHSNQRQNDTVGHGRVARLVVPARAHAKGELVLRPELDEDGHGFGHVALVLGLNHGQRRTDGRHPNGGGLVKPAVVVVLSSSSSDD